MDALQALSCGCPAISKRRVQSRFGALELAVHDFV
jgi:hypothetical protein